MTKLEIKATLEDGTVWKYRRDGIVEGFNTGADGDGIEDLMQTAMTNASDSFYKTLLLVGEN